MVQIMKLRIAYYRAPDGTPIKCKFQSIKMDIFMLALHYNSMLSLLLMTFN